MNSKNLKKMKKELSNYLARLGYMGDYENLEEIYKFMVELTENNVIER